MSPPKSENEIRGFLGWLQYISWFIAKLTSSYELIFKLLRKNEPLVRNDECKKAFELIKEYLLHPPILVPSKHGKPLLLYLFIIEDAIGSMLAQEDDDKNEKAVYYLSKRFHDYETRYTYRKVMLCSCVGRMEIEAHHPAFPSMDSSQNGPYEVSI